MRQATLTLICALAPALAACEDECQNPKGEAQALIDSYAACGADEDCEVVSLYDIGLGSETCITAFQCHAALNVDADLDQLVAEAKDIADDWSKCGECAIAECADLEAGGTPFGKCNIDTSLCEIGILED